MLRYAVISLAIANVAAVFGFIASGSVMSIARTIFFIFLLLAVVLFVLESRENTR